MMEASLFNFIIFTKSCPSDSYVRAIVEQVVQKFPSNILFLKVDDEKKEDNVSSQSSKVKIGSGDQAVVCDFLEMTASGQCIEQFPLLILPHLVPDLPIYILWAYSLSDYSSILDILIKRATRVIFDSEYAEDLFSFAEKLLSIKQLYPYLDIADLNWARIENWRELFIDTFHLPEKYALLTHANRLTISYNAKRHPPFMHSDIQAVYLQAWLATRLSWKPESTTTEEDVVHFNYDKVQVQLKPISLNDQHSGSISQVDLYTSDNDHVSFQKSATIPHQIQIECTTSKQCDLPSHFIYRKGIQGQPLVKEVFHRGTSLFFLDLLHFLSQKRESC